MTSSGLSFEMLPVLVNSAPTWSQMTRPSGAKRVSRAPVTSRPCAIVKFPAVSTAQAFQLVKAIRRVVAGLRLLAEAEQESGGCLRGIDPDDVHLVGSAVGHVEQVVWTESKGPNMLYRF